MNNVKMIGRFFFKFFWPSQNILTLIKFVDWEVDSFSSSFPRNCSMHLIWKLLEGARNKQVTCFLIYVFLTNESKNCRSDQAIFFFTFFNPCFQLCPSSKVVLKVIKFRLSRKAGLSFLSWGPSFTSGRPL